MKSFSASIVIRARPETVWTLLIDAPGYPTWNSTVEKVDGRIAADEKITVYAKAASGRAFPVKVSAFAPPLRMEWRGASP